MLLFLTVKQRILLLVTLPLLAFILLGSFVMHEINNMQHEIDEMFEHRLLPMHEIASVQNDLTVDIAELLYANHQGKLSGDELKRQVAEVRSHAMKEWSAYTSISHGPQEEEMIAQTKPLIAALDSWLDSMLSGINGAPASDAQLNQLRELATPLNDKLERLIEKQVQMSQELKQQGDQEAAATRKVLLGSGIGLLLLLSLIGVAVFRGIHSSLSELGNTISYITQSADLTRRVAVKGSDELANIGHSFNSMTAKLQSLVNNIFSGIKTLSAASEEMSNISSVMASTSEQQSQQTTMIATAVTEMNAAIAEVSQNAVNTSNQASEVESLTKEGGDAIRDSIESVEVLAGIVISNAEIIQDLNKQSNEINQVVLMIRGVAEQTNLLALNAAIEAARAGDSGRGFAVVADEVRQLAHNTQKATENITEMINRLQSMSQQAVKEMGRAEASARSSREKAENSSSIIGQIQASINQIVMMNAQVSTATEEQAAVIADIAQSINEFQESIASVTENAQHNADASTELANLGVTLKDEVARFKV
ncbi:methyl-accepting chemotaxis protein [Shewanella sp. JM162201]|uniref:Methyl-accepting chemotaxis protein n=1 Tax=Shewanella jiangmenensis TaxID=2837387 RepID=A0ABS5V8X1_9GAMM|nr:methyl-accepting chemotaxis protein [Shewanella jiangmenensis]MBT1446171.1 methyl-accepting chemotaxis protein [Shewanella jiangmenensis]